MPDIVEVADGNFPIIQAAFLSVIEEIRTYLFDVQELETALINNDVSGAVQASRIGTMEDLIFGIGMSNDAYIMSDTVQTLYNLGAKTAVGNLPPNLQKVFSYDPIGERAVQFMRTDGMTMAVDLTTASTTGVRAVIERSLAENSDPKKMVKEIRQLIGLTEPQAQAVLNFRRQLEERQNLGFTSADERRLNAVEQAMVRRHLKNGHFSQQDIDSMVERYYQSLINKRALDIARTESLNAVNNGQQEMWEQGLDQGIFDEYTRRFWVTAGDDKVRPTHAAIPIMNPDGVKIRGMFITPFGPVVGPGDRNVNLINCRCLVVIGQD